MAEQERRKWTWALPKKMFLAAVGFAAITSLISLICGVSVSREVGNLPDDFLLNAQARVLGSTFLAYQQSFGFFDDIPDKSWRLMQQRALKSSSSQYSNPGLPETTDEYLKNLQVSGRFQKSGDEGDLCHVYSPSFRSTNMLSCSPTLLARVSIV
jgi:hypothetical protein